MLAGSMKGHVNPARASVRRCYSTSVRFLLPREPISTYSDGKGWEFLSAASLLHTDNFALTDDFRMGAISDCGRDLKPHIHDRGGLENRLRSEQDSGMTDVFRLRLKPFLAVWYAISNRHMDRKAFRPI